ncbi:MAG: iron uptake porin [Cyanobacteria bacterium P01_E01_bin.42]
MDKQFWKLQLLKSPAILGMAALTLVSTSTAIAIEPETSLESSILENSLTESSLELQTESANLEEVAIAPDTRGTKTLGKKAISFSTPSAEEIATSDIAEQVNIPIVEFSNDAIGENISADISVSTVTESAVAEIAEVTVESEELEELARSEDDVDIEALLGFSSAPTQIAQVYNTPSNAPNHNGQMLDRVNQYSNEQIGGSNGQVLDRVNQYSNEETNGSMGQGVPGAARFSDVSPSDWAYQALDDLVRRYDCLKGYPNGTYRGNRALSRYEFAAGLNACLQQIERLIAASTADFVTRQDLEALQRLIQEFEAELATLGTRVDNLEGRVAFLEDHQFSTTTKLSGEAIFALTSNFGGDTDISGVTDSISEAAFGNRVRLEFNTSFFGTDRLATRLRAGNLTTASTATQVAGSLNNVSAGGSFSGSQTFTVPSTQGGNDVYLDWLAYYFQYLNSQAYVAATGGKWSDIAPTLNPYFEDFDGGDGSLSTFGQRNSIFRIGGGAGAALSFGFTPIESILGPSTVTFGYFAGTGAATAGAGSGLFNGDYAVMGHLNANISDTFGLGLTYVHGYHSSGSPIYAEGLAENGGGANGLVGSFQANNPSSLFLFDGVNLTSGNSASIPTVTNSYGVEFSLRPSETVVINGGVTYTNATLLRTGNADIWSYALGVAFPDLGKEGNVLGLYGGVQPTVRGLRGNWDNEAIDLDRYVWHVEGFYKYQVTDNISITPGVIWVVNPNQGEVRNYDLIGTLRTTFSF